MDISDGRGQIRAPHPPVRRDRPPRRRDRRRQGRVARRDVPRAAPPKGVRIPNGFATTARAFREFVERRVAAGHLDRGAARRKRSAASASGRRARARSPRRSRRASPTRRPRTSSRCTRARRSRAPSSSRRRSRPRSRSRSRTRYARPLPRVPAEGPRRRRALLGDVRGLRAASFAGQCESYLNIHGAGAGARALEAVRREPLHGARRQLPDQEAPRSARRARCRSS